MILAHSNRRVSRRPGFTLIEMIVVVSIILVLASMIVAVALTANNKQLVSTGATELQGWFKIAQQYALRDQKPYGVRFNLAAGNIVAGGQYIEQPPDWVGPVGSTIATKVSPNATGATIKVTASGGVDFSGGWSSTYAAADSHWAVQVGDYLECQSPALICPITSLTTTTLTCNMMPPDTTPLATGIAMWSFSGCANWRIVRQPREMIGSDPLNLPNGVAINFATNSTYGASPAPNGGNIDVVFSPTGAVITPGMTGQNLKFWVLDTSVNPNAATQNVFVGDQLIVMVAIRTGMVSIQPVDLTGQTSANPPAGTYSQPYSFTQNGRVSGF